MRLARWSRTAAALALTLVACAGAPAASPGSPTDQPQESDEFPVLEPLAGTITVTRHLVQSGPRFSRTDDSVLTLQVRLKQDVEMVEGYLDAGSTYSYSGSFVEHSEQGETAVCISDQSAQGTGSGAIGSGLSMYGGPTGGGFRLAISILSHWIGHGQVVCDGVVSELMSGDTDTDLTISPGCRNVETLDATGTRSTGYDFACTQVSVQGEGQTVVTGTVGPP